MRNLPNPPKSFLTLVGPGLVLIAMGLGSGEFVLWPYLVSQFGFGVLWGAVLGITFQYFVSNETGRYTLATGNSVFVGFKKLSRFLPAWFILSTFLSFAWPGIIASGGAILGELLGIQDFKWLTILMLIIIGLIFTLGGKVYTNLERVQKIFMLISIPSLILIVALIIDSETVVNLSKGLIGIGEGYLFFPVGIVIGQFLGSIAYSGAAGNLILSHSFYIQDKGLGMAKGDSQVEIGKHSFVDEELENFTITPDNVSKFKKWFKAVALEQFISFTLLGLITIILLAVIAYVLVFPGSHASDLNFIFLEAEKLREISDILGSVLLIMGVVFLFTTQLGVFESTSRIMSENLHIGFKRFKKTSLSKLFFVFLWSQILFGIVIVLLDIATPLSILFINTFFSAVSMFVLSGATLWLNTSKFIPEEIRPGIVRKLILLISFLFFGVFTVVAVINI